MERRSNTKGFFQLVIKRHRKNQNLGKIQIIFNKMMTMEKKTGRRNGGLPLLPGTITVHLPLVHNSGSACPLKYMMVYAPC